MSNDPETAVVGRLVITYRSGGPTHSIKLIRERDVKTLRMIIEAFEAELLNADRLRALLDYMVMTYTERELREKDFDPKAIRQMLGGRKPFSIQAYTIAQSSSTGRSHLKRTRTHELDYWEITGLELKDRIEVELPF